MSKCGLVIGCPGQDSIHLIKLLLDKNYSVVGVKRRTSTNNTARLEQFFNNSRFQLVEGDITDLFSMSSIIKDCLTTHDELEIYILAAQSHVGTSFKQPKYTMDVNYGGVLNVLEASRPWKNSIKIYFAATSEMFGDNYSTSYDELVSVKLVTFAESNKVTPNCEGIKKLSEILSNNVGGTYNLEWGPPIKTESQKYQDENTPFSPMSPYAVSKVAAFNLCNNYRKAYNMFICSGILFNHEGEYRGEEFLTQKVCKYVAEVKTGKRKDKLKLGNLFSYRDFGYAGDYVKAMWLMLQQNKPDDYVIATGETWQIEDFVDKAFKYVRLDWKEYVEIDQSLIRPSEVDYLKGNASKAKKILNWEPTVKLDELISIMIEAQLEKLR